MHNDFSSRITSVQSRAGTLVQVSEVAGPERPSLLWYSHQTSLMLTERWSTVQDGIYRLYGINSVRTYTNVNLR
jgi:hypothetical protein